MTIALSLLTAFCWGSGNFVMGLATRKLRAETAVFVAFTTGALGMSAVVGFGTHFGAAAFGWGSLSGVFQALGWMFFAFALRDGRIGVVNALVATCVTILLFVYGVLTGDALTIVAVVGAVIAVIAISLLSRPFEDEATEVKSPVSIGRPEALALSAAASFAIQLLCLRHAQHKFAIDALWGDRLTVSILFGAVAFRSARVAKAAMFSRSQALLGIAVLGGILILSGDASYIAATGRGRLTVVSVLAGLQPLFTVLLSTTILRERLNRAHVIGFVAALAGATLIALG